MITNMALDSPKRAVVINSYNSKLVCSIPSQRYTPLITYNDNIQIKTESCSQKKGRKRSLDHLSYEEKLQRKKLKNREAAQTSRDRKKARMDELERTVKGIERTNKELRSEVSTLRLEKEEMRKENEELRKENERLKEELRCARCTLESTPGSAVSTVYPLPQGRSSHPAHLVSPIALLVSPELDNLDLFWDLDGVEPDLSTLDELVQKLSSMSEQASTESTATTPEQMVGQTPAQLESSVTNVPFTNYDDLIEPTADAKSSTIIQDAWKMTSPTSKISSVPSPTIFEIKEEQEFVLDDMISEEIVITSEDHFLNEASCDEKITTKSICSDFDMEDRNSDQGYESIDSPSSDIDSTLPELFPELL